MPQIGNHDQNERKSEYAISARQSMETRQIVQDHESMTYRQSHVAILPFITICENAEFIYICLNREFTGLSVG